MSLSRWFQFSFTTHFIFRCVMFLAFYMTNMFNVGFFFNFLFSAKCNLFNAAVFLLSMILPLFIRPPGEQIQHKACAGYYCCVGSGVLSHTGNGRWEVKYSFK